MNRHVAEASRAAWHAQLELDFYAARDRTCLQRQHSGPLRVQRPFYPEGRVCHTYLLHPPGGIVGGDTLGTRVRVNRDASALVTTPGAAKFYRSMGSSAVVEQLLSIEGELEWLPQDNILFGGSQVETSTRINLGPKARFLGWETWNFGRPAAADFYTSGQLLSRWEIYRNERPLLIDRLAIDAGSRHSSSGLRGAAVSGVMVATPIRHEQKDQLRQHPALNTQCVLSLIDDLLIVRYLGNDNEACSEQLKALWRTARKMLFNRGPGEPRIWAT